MPSISTQTTNANEVVLNHGLGLWLSEHVGASYRRVEVLERELATVEIDLENTNAALDGATETIERANQGLLVWEREYDNVRNMCIRRGLDNRGLRRANGDLIHQVNQQRAMIESLAKDGQALAKALRSANKRLADQAESDGWIAKRSKP